MKIEHFGWLATNTVQTCVRRSRALVVTELVVSGRKWIWNIILKFLVHFLIRFNVTNGLKSKV